MMIAHLIFYVRDQKKSTEFYSFVLAMEPKLNVPGMTEFELSEKCVLGLMPESGIRRLLGEPLPDPSKASGIPRAELYLIADDAQVLHDRAIMNGAQPLSEFQERDWGDRVAYCLDIDGHVLAFAQRSE